MEEEEERTPTFYVYHPCYFLHQALRAFFKCLGIERTSSPQTHAAADPTINSPTNTQTSLDAADPSSVTDFSIVCLSQISLCKYLHVCLFYFFYHQSKHILDEPQFQVQTSYIHTTMLLYRPQK
ncbi:hypothetical protein V8G54_030410 [Vigna mungo]|uniref:Uncharacterized protein n=1 Tax=Vigna mungo TaxID=3915 RepID=A0AAQ3MV45_VIGMU